MGVAALVAGSYVWTRGAGDVGNVPLLSASGAFLFLLFDGPFFLLGNRLNTPTDGSSAE